MSTPDGPGAAAPAVDPWASPPLGTPAAPSAPPRPPDQWSFPAQAPPQSTNAAAAVALVTGLLALVPVAVPAGIIGIVQTTRRRQPGRALAIGGLAASALWVLAATVALVTLGSAWEPRTGAPSDVGVATVGACLDAPEEGSGRWTAASCTDVHDAEVYVVEELEERGEDGDWPGEDVVEGQADDTCHAAFEDYVGRSYFTSDHDYAWFTPREQDWSDGERRVVCVVVPFEDDVLHAPARDSGD